MSWLSERLAGIGISKAAQRKVTKPLAIAGATALLGPLAGAAVAKYLPAPQGGSYPGGLQDIAQAAGAGINNEILYPTAASPGAQLTAFVSSPVGLVVMGLVAYKLLKD